MSKLTKIAASVLLLLAILLGFLAYRIAVRPIAPLPTAPIARIQHYQENMVTVVVTSKALPAGAKLDAASLSTQQWPLMPTGGVGLADKDKLIGQSTRVGLASGEPVTIYSLALGLGRYLNPGERAVTISVDEVVGAANRIVPGDNVDIFVSLDHGQEVSGTQTRLLQSKVRVLAYGLQSLDGPPPGQTSGISPQRAAPVQAARTAMLAVPIARVDELLMAAKSGRLQLALRSPDDPGVADPSLFTPRIPVLSARADLTVTQKQLLNDDVNKAYAGDSLPQLAGPPPVVMTEPKHSAPRARAGGGGRSIEVVRGGSTETVRY